MGNISLFLVTITIIIPLVNSLQNVVSVNTFQDGGSFMVYCDANRVNIPSNVTSIDTLRISRQVVTARTPTLIAQYTPSVPSGFRSELKNIPSSRKWNIIFSGGNGGKNNRKTMKIEMSVTDAMSSDEGLYICQVAYLTGTNNVIDTREASQNIKRTVPVHTCDRGWFGDRCQYRCRCSKGECAYNGTCLAGDRCDTQWFGPTCQYMNLANNVGGSVYADPRLLDQDDSTCTVVVPRRQSVYVQKREPFVFTWMMLVTEGFPARVTHPFHVTALSDETEKRLLNCNNERQHIYGNTVHIYCDFEAEKVNYVEVETNHPIYTCSWYINGGRNVALKQQNTRQSSSNSDLYKSKNVVDGDDSRTCTGTKPGATKHSWSLSFARSMMIHRIRIYSYFSRISKAYKGNHNFRISTYDQRGAQVHLFKDTHQKPRPSYFTFRFHPASLSRIEVWVNDNNRYSSVLFCELQALGDCPAGYYGLECEKKCSFFCPETCSVIDGQCDAVAIQAASDTARARAGLCPAECKADCDMVTGQCLGVSSTGTPMIVFLIIITVGIVSALSIAGFKLLLKRKEPRT